MFEYLFDYISKPFAGLAIVVRLFVAGGPDSKDPSIASLKFVNTADSVFVQASIRSGITPEIKDLMDAGVVVKTTCTFSCGAFVKTWERRLQYNPVKRSGCRLSQDGACESFFKAESLATQFSRMEFYLADVGSVKKMHAAPARMKISTSINVEAMALGKKELWPSGIVADFNVPEMTIMK